MQRKILLLGFALFVVAVYIFISIGSIPQVVQAAAYLLITPTPTSLPPCLRFTGLLSGNQEVPAVVTATEGDFTITYDSTVNQTNFVVRIMPNSQAINVTGMHIHAAPQGVNGPIIRNLNTPFIGIITDTLTISGIVTPSLNSSEIQQLLNNRLYINVHTSVNPGGEIRGQINNNGDNCSTATPTAMATRTLTPISTATTPVALPDLRVESMKIELETGGNCSYSSTVLGVHVTVSNDGDASASPFGIAVNGQPKSVDSGLAANSTIDVWIPGSLIGENTAVVDVTAVVAESNENNNTLTQFLPIPTLPPTCTPTVASPDLSTMTPTSTATQTNDKPVQFYLPAIANIPAPAATVSPIPIPPIWRKITGSGLNVAALAVQGNTLFVGTSGNSGNARGLYRGSLTSCPTGVVLAKVGDVNRPDGESVFDVVFADNKGVIASYDVGIYYTSDSGNTWITAVPSLAQPRTVTSVSNTFFVGTQGNGIYQSNDGGMTWVKEMGVNFPQDINTVVADSIDPAKLWIGAQETGVWAYTVGASRQPSNPTNGLESSARNIWSIVFDSANNIYLATEGGIYQGNGISKWLPFGSSPSGVQFRSMALIDTTLYTGAANNGVWRKALTSGNWERVTSSGWNETTTVRDLFYDNAHCNGLLAATNDGV